MNVGDDSCRCFSNFNIYMNYLAILLIPKYESKEFDLGHMALSQTISQVMVVQYHTLNSKCIKIKIENNSGGSELSN